MTQDKSAPVRVRADELQGGDEIVLHEGVLVVDGEVYASNSIPGLTVVETEVGSLYLDPERTLEVIR